MAKPCYQHKSTIAQNPHTYLIYRKCARRNKAALRLKVLQLGIYGSKFKITAAQCNDVMISVSEADPIRLGRAESPREDEEQIPDDAEQKRGQSGIAQQNYRLSLSKNSVEQFNAASYLMHVPTSCMRWPATLAHSEAVQRFKERSEDLECKPRSDQISKLQTVEEEERLLFETVSWQKTTSTPVLAGKLGIVGQLFQGCIDIYSELLGLAKQDLSIAPKEKTILERNYHTLCLWADGHGILSGQLDIVLQRSIDLQQTVLLALTSLSEVIYHRKSSPEVFRTK